jgi:flagellar basal-body rod modification protein FlgD
MSSPVGGTGASTPYATSTATGAVSRDDQMGSDMFLKLLVAEMKYQDPASPMSTSDMMAQTATLTQTQSLQQIAKQNSDLVSLQRSLSAAAMVGQTVSYTDTDGTTKSGLVSAVKMSTSDNTSQAVIGGKSVDVGRITQVGAVPSTAATA